jgi:hypothetical protein
MLDSALESFKDLSSRVYIIFNEYNNLWVDAESSKLFQFYWAPYKFLISSWSFLFTGSFWSNSQTGSMRMALLLVSNENNRSKYS